MQVCKYYCLSLMIIIIIIKIIRNHSIFDVLLYAKASPSSICVIVANAVYRVTDTINNNII